MTQLVLNHEPGTAPNDSRASLVRLAVTVEEGARMLGVGRATLYKLVMRGEIESFTIGRARRIAVATLERYAQMPRSA